MTEFDPANFSTVEPQEFARIVKSTSDAKIAEVMGSDQRQKILTQVFDRMPQLFRADRAGSTNAIIHWTITGRPDGGADTFEIVISNGTCTASPTPRHDPKLSLTMGPVDFVKLISGSGNPMMMFMTGKLKAKGDLGLAANVQNLFDIPKA